MGISGKNVYSKLVISRFTKAINIIDNLKTTVLLNNDIFIPKSINLFINKEKITINRCLRTIDNLNIINSQLFI